MAKIRLHAYKVRERTAYSVAIELGIGSGPPIPDLVIEARNVPQVKVALEAYAKTAQTTGLPLQLNATVARGERAPNGFNKAEAANELRLFVNC